MRTFGQEGRTLSECTDWAAGNALRMNRVELKMGGETDDKKAKSFVRVMLATGLAEKL